MEKSSLEQVGGFPTKIQNIVVKNGNVPPTKHKSDQVLKDPNHLAELYTFT